MAKVAQYTKEQMEELTRLAEEFERVREEFLAYVVDIVSEWDADFTAKSDRWQDSEAGQHAQSTIDGLVGVQTDLEIAELSKTPWSLDQEED